MPQTAVLFMDLQYDFLANPGGRMPVDRSGACTVIRIANEILAKKVLAEAIPIVVLNSFPASGWIGNFFRKGAAIAGTTGAMIDARIMGTERAEVFEKCSPNAFSNPALDKFLRKHKVDEIYVLGVFAEGCVRSTAVNAIKRGYRTRIIVEAVASNSTWKKRFGLWAMLRAGSSLENWDTIKNPLNSSSHP